MASNSDLPEEKQNLMEGEEVPAKSEERRDGTRVFKKASPNGKITVYVGRRDFVDHVSKVDPVDGVVLVDPEYFNKEGKQDRKVFAQVLAGFRYGREDLDVLGLNFRRDLIDERMQVFPPPDDNTEPQLVTLLQVRLMKKLGKNAYPFSFTLKPGLPSSVTLQPSQGETEKPCGVDFILRCYVAKTPEDRIEKRNSVRLAIKKVPHSPDDHTQRPTQEVSKEFMLSSQPLVVEANLDKGTYHHGESIRINVAVANRSNKTVKRIKLQVRQFASICLFAQSEHKCIVAQMESDEGFPINPGGALQRTYELTPLLSKNRDKRGLALDGQIKHEDTCLASSTILPPGTEETKEVQEKMGIMVHYNAKIRCVVSFGTDLTLELPFTLTHPKPKPIISQMITLPSRNPTTTDDSASSTSEPTQEPSESAGGGGGEPAAAAMADEETNEIDKPSHASLQPRPSLTVYEAIDHNLINFDTDGQPQDQDFVFEEFVRLRVAGVEESNETEA